MAVIPCFPSEDGKCWVCQMEDGECGEPEAYQKPEDLTVIPSEQIRAAFDRIQREVGGQMALF